LFADLPRDAVACVVDNASTDGSVEYIRQTFSGATVLPLARNLGFVQATNLGLLAGLEAGAESFVLLNNDTRVRRGWLDALRSAAERRPDFGVFGAWQVDFEGKPSPRTSAIARASADAGVVETDWVEGSCLWMRRVVLEKVGFLDPLFAPAYFEEIDFCRRARRAGFRVGLAVDSVIEHFGAGSSLADAGKRRQRILNERNYLVYHAADPERRGLGRLGELALRTMRHGWKAARRGEITMSEWATAAAGVSMRLPGIWAKARRDRRNWPCPILGNRSLSTPEQRYYAECVARITGRPEPCKAGFAN
jgi:GT2 family glycosyltransferase